VKNIGKPYSTDSSITRMTGADVGEGTVTIGAVEDHSSLWLCPECEDCLASENLHLGWGSDGTLHIFGDFRSTREGQPKREKRVGEGRPWLEAGCIA